MAKHGMPETPDVTHIHNEGVAHEDTDMSLGGITKFVIHLILLVAISAVLMWGLFNYLNKREQTIEERETPSTLLKRDRPSQENPTEIFPEPRLQTTPVVDLNVYRQMVDERLRSYTWVDKEKGIVSIPIEEAKAKLLERGLGSAKPAGPTIAPTEAPTGPATGKTSPAAKAAGEHH
jgi:hypothetical protein